MILTTNKYEVLTPTGFQSFNGIRKKYSNENIKITTNFNEITVSIDHEFVVGGVKKKAKDLIVNDEIENKEGNDFVVSIEKSKDEEVFDLLEVENGNVYYTNNIVSHNCSFIGSSASLIKGDKLKTLTFKKPTKELEDSKFKIYETPIPKDKYVLICDVCEGIGKDYSTIQVINITTLPYKQVAVYRDNEIKPFSYHLIIDKIGKYYNTGLVIIERNNCGAEVIDNLHYELDYENCFYGDEFGFRTTAKTKRTGCSNLKFLIENDSLLINDYETINELSRFVYDGKTFKAQDYDGHDDLVMPLVIFSYLVLDKTLSELWFETCLTERVNKEKEEELEEFFVLIGNDIE